MSPVRFFLYFTFILFVPSSWPKEDEDLLTRIKTLDDPNDLWDLLKTASRTQPEEVEKSEESDFDDLFGDGDEDDDLFKSEEMDNEVSTQIYTVKSTTQSPLTTLTLVTPTTNEKETPKITDITDTLITTTQSVTTDKPITSSTPTKIGQTEISSTIQNDKVNITSTTEQPTLSPTTLVEQTTLNTVTQTPNLFTTTSKQFSQNTEDLSTTLSSTEASTSKSNKDSSTKSLPPQITTEKINSTSATLTTENTVSTNIPTSTKNSETTTTVPLSSTTETTSKMLTTTSALPSTVPTSTNITVTTPKQTESTKNAASETNTDKIIQTTTPLFLDKSTLLPIESSTVKNTPESTITDSIATTTSVPFTLLEAKSTITTSSTLISSTEITATTPKLIESTTTSKATSDTSPSTDMTNQTTTTVSSDKSTILPIETTIVVSFQTEATSQKSTSTTSLDSMTTSTKTLATTVKDQVDTPQTTQMSKVTTEEKSVVVETTTPLTENTSRNNSDTLNESITSPKENGTTPTPTPTTAPSMIPEIANSTTTRPSMIEKETTTVSESKSSLSTTVTSESTTMSTKTEENKTPSTPSQSSSTTTTATITANPLASTTKEVVDNIISVTTTTTTTNPTTLITQKPTTNPTTIITQKPTTTPAFIETLTTTEAILSPSVTPVITIKPTVLSTPSSSLEKILTTTNEINSSSQESVTPTINDTSTTINYSKATTDTTVTTTTAIPTTLVASTIIKTPLTSSTTRIPPTTSQKPMVTTTKNLFVTTTKKSVTTSKPVTTTSKKQPTTSKKPVVTTTKKSVTTSKKTAITTTKIPVTTRKPEATTTKKSPTTSKKTLVTTTKKPVEVTTKKTVATTTKKTPTTSKKAVITVTTTNKSVTTSKKPVVTTTTKKPATTRKTVSTTTKKPPTTSKKTLVTTTKKPVVTTTNKPGTTRKPVATTSKKTLVTTTKKPVEATTKTILVTTTKKTVTTSKKTVSTTTKKPVTTRKTEGTTTRKPPTTSKRTLFATTNKLLTTPKKHVATTRKLPTTPKTMLKTTTVKPTRDILPPPPLPPLPPPPTFYSKSETSSIPSLPNFSPSHLCPAISSCRNPSHSVTSTPRLHTTNFKPTPKNTLLEPRKTYIIEDHPMNSHQVPPKVKPGLSLIPENTFPISSSSEITKPTSTTRPPLTIRTHWFRGNSDTSYPNYFTNSGQHGEQPLYPNRPVAPQSSRESPNHNFYIQPVPNSPTSNVLGNRMGIILTDHKPQVYVNTRAGSPDSNVPQRGVVQIFPFVGERRNIPNQPFNLDERLNTRNPTGTLPSHLVPIVITRQNPQHDLNSNPHIFVKPKFDFIVTNVSNSPGGQFQIKPIVRSPDSVRFHINGPREGNTHSTGPHVQGRDMVLLVKPQPYNPHSVWSYSPAGSSNAPSYKVTYNRNKRSLPPDVPTDIQGSSLVFVFDTTGSMASELRQVQQQATKLAIAMTVHPDKPIYDYVFVPFNDPVVGPVTRTRDHAYFQNILDGIRVDGGGDCPEMSMKALLLALEQSLPGSFIYVFTDASAKDSHLKEEVLKLNQRKQSMVMFLLTGNCYERDETYDIISTASGGQVYDLEKTDVSEVWETIKHNLNSRKVNLVSFNSNEPAPQPKPYTMPIDDNLEQFTVSITGANPTLSVYDTKGTLAVPPRVKDLLNLPNIKVVNVPDPEPGEWTVKVGSESGYTVRSSGLSKSNVKFSYGFSVIPTRSMAETAHRPLQGTQNSLLIKTSLPTRECNLTHISLLDFEGKVFAKILLTPINHEEGLYVGGPVLPPNKYFNMEAHGYDSGGHKLVRIFPSAITPQLPDLPEVNVKPDMLAVAGGNVNLECHVESLVPVTVKWFKDGRIKSAVEYKQSSKSVLQVDNVSPESAGNYTCWTKNIAGISTKHIQVKLAEAPTVYVTNEVRHLVETRTKLPCRVQSDLPYNVSWSRKISIGLHGGTRDENLDFLIKFPEDQQNDYFIDDLKVEDEGWYTCTATNKGGSKKGKTFLKVLSPPVVEEPLPVKFMSNVPLVVSCKLLRPEPLVQVVWDKKDSSIKDGYTTVAGAEDNNYMYQLIIHNPDRSDEGFYRCIAENNFGKVTKTTRVTYVSEPKVRSEKEEVIVKEGATAILRCILTDGTPPPTITWFKQSIEIINYPTNMKSLEGGAVLKIENVRKGDVSKYFCLARNEAGESRASVDLQIGIKPSIVSPSKDGSGREVEYGGSLEIPCKANGKPSPYIVWTKTSASTTYEFYQNTLKIQDAKLESEGEYTCTAKNPFGHDEVKINITLTGLEKPSISGSETEWNVKGLVGQRIELPCLLLAGNPLANITWFKDGIRLTPSIYNNIVLTNGSFVIPVLTLRHVGTYKCQAQNIIGSDNKHYSLSTYDAPKMNMSLGSFILAKLGTNVTLPCHIRGDPQPVVTWYKESTVVDRPFRGFRINGSDNLYISNVNEEDSGRYICKAENIAGIARRAIILSVISSPRILNVPREVSAVSGDVVFLNCPTAGIPRPTIRWLKNNRPLHHVRGSIGNNYLRFFSDPSDSGEYTCIAENKAGEDRATTHLMILEPPKIDETTEDLIEGILGGSVELPCQVSGTPRPFIIWQHKGQTIKKILPSGNSSVSLPLTNLTEEHKGTYICIASNKAGSSRRTVELSVLVPPVIDDWEGPFKVIPGDTITVACNVYGFPKPTIKWVKNGQPLPPEFFTHNNILRFIVESSHSGNYTCIAENKAGNDTKDVLISVYEAPRFVLEQSEDMEILQGSDVRILCSAKGDPKPVISWFYNGRILEIKNNIRFFQDKDVMLINHFDEVDEGIYECAATNKAGSNSRSIKMNVLVPPKVTKWSDDMSVKEGNEVILSCDVKGKPEPLVAWKKNGTPLPSDLSYRGNKIRFIATEADKGNYSCHASNKVGNDVKHTFLIVKVHPQIVGDQEEDIVVLHGDGLELKCKAKGVPEPIISWNFNSTLINNLPNAAFKLKGSNLFIPKIDFHNAGLYLCLANNSLGTAQKSFQVTVHVPPSITDESQDAITLKEGDDFSISCSSYGVPTPDIFWINNDRIYKKGFHNEHYVVMNDHTLIISNAQLDMSGNYFCVATNIEGSAMKNYTIDVVASEKDPESESKNMTLVEIEESDDGVLNCPLTEGPISWLKDNDGIDLSGNERADDIHLQLLDGGRTLKLGEAYPSDSGIYTCYTDYGTSAQFFVKVLVRPYFLQEFPQTEFELKLGDQLTLDCNAAGNPTPKINWRHVEKDIPITKHTVPGVLVKGDEKDTLHFPAVKVHHAGRYMCLASNKVGKEGRVFTVKVTEPPVLLGEREEKITAISGNTLDLECTVNGSPQPRYTWKHISSTGKENALRHNQKRLTINSLKSNDGGIYICNGTNKVGSTVKYFFVFVLEAPYIRGNNLEDIQMPEGKEMEVECEASGVPLPSLTWQLDSRQIDSTRAIITSTKPQSNGTQTSTLRIKSVDETVAGVYTCLASNDVATTQKHYRLSIIVPPVLSDQSFLFNKKSLDINEGQAIYLSCPVRQDQQVKIEWFVTANETRKQFEKYSNGNLYISSAKPSDGGVYSCVASNDAGQVEASFIINISEPPSFGSNNYEKTLTLTQEDELILNCSVNSKPQSQIIWLKDGLRVTGKRNSLLTLLNHNQTLVISDIKSDDSGKYICIASNHAGSAERSFYVNIHEAPKIEGMSSSQISIETNKTETHFSRVILRCPLTGSPQPIIKWFKDSSIVEENERIHITPHGGKLIIFYLTEEEAGRYSCTAQNQAGVNKLFFNLKVIVVQEWSSWTEWSNCSKLCDRGIQTRNRSCGQEPTLKNQRNPYIEYDKTACKGSSTDTRSCNTHPCKVNGEWGGWSEWGSCSASCGEGTRTRARRCDNPAPAFGGARCKGLHMDTSVCKRPSCPIDGQWSSWTEWSDCTVTCGEGLKYRERKCNSPEPKDGGRSCPGVYRDVQVCNPQKCPIDGRWTGWRKWGQCSVTCGTGTQVRYRHCYKPLYGGQPCTGSNREVRMCENRPCVNEAYAAALTRADDTVYDGDEMIGSDQSHHHQSGSSNGNSPASEMDLTRTRARQSEQGISPENEAGSKITHASGTPSETVLLDEAASTSSVNRSIFEGDNIFEEKQLSHVDKSTNKSVTFDLSLRDVLLTSDEVRSHYKRAQCPTGFKENKTSNICQDINECRHRKWNRCKRYKSKCINTIGSYKCVCTPGFRLQQGPKKKCIDINECKEKKALCSHFCHNTKGGYKCSCPDGLSLLEDTHTCLQDASDYIDYSPDGEEMYPSENSDADKSVSEWNDMSDYDLGYQRDAEVVKNDSEILELRGSNDVICPKGFIKQENNCKDINECALELHNCTAEQVCINTLGYYKCVDAPCPVNFDLVPSIRSCQFECRKNQSRCYTGTKIAETITYESFDTENKTLSSLQDIVLLLAYDEKQQLINNTVYHLGDTDYGIPVAVRKENNMGILYTTEESFVTGFHSVDVIGFTRSDNPSLSDNLYAHHFVVFIYNSFTVNDVDLNSDYE